MANLYWPSEKTFKYSFKELNREESLEIPLIDNKKLKGIGKENNDETR